MTVDSSKSWWTILLATLLPWAIVLILFKLIASLRKQSPGRLKRIQVFVLGDIGRSPRMQYHALSLAQLGYSITFIGYQDSPLHPDVAANARIHVIPLEPFPKWLNTDNRKIFLIAGPLKVLFQVGTLLVALLSEGNKPGWLLVQNPPSIPTLVVAQMTCLLSSTRLIIDWHNFGYSILALKLSRRHPLVRISELYERIFSRNAYAHLCVTNAMAKMLERTYDLRAPILALHDRPAKIFKVLDDHERLSFLDSLPSKVAVGHSLIQCVKSGETRLIISSTSWTPDEDFSVLLDALCSYSNPATDEIAKPRLLVIITGKGPQKAAFEGRIKQLESAKRLRLVMIRTVFFDDFSDYARLLGSADVGISLHTSSSGVDLPMKVLDMFGAGLPVIGFDNYEAWPELVEEGVNGLGFKDADGLARVMTDLLCINPPLLKRLREGAVAEGKRRWEDEWGATAGTLFR